MLCLKNAPAFFLGARVEGLADGWRRTADGGGRATGDAATGQKLRSAFRRDVWRGRACAWALRRWQSGDAPSDTPAQSDRNHGSAVKSDAQLEVRF